MEGFIKPASFLIGMGPITRELLQQGLLDYLAIMIIFEPGREANKEERGAFVIEPRDIAELFSQEEYVQLYRANSGVLARMLKSPRPEMRNLAYAFDRMHWKVRLEYARSENSQR